MGFQRLFAFALIFFPLSPVARGKKMRSLLATT
jgi:hypothetical protein